MTLLDISVSLLHFFLFDLSNHWYNFVENARGIVRIRGSKIDRNGTTYVKFDQLDTKIQIPKAKFHLKNLFNGDPTLSEVGNQFVNQNSELFLAEITPGLEKSLSKTFLDIVNVILKDVTFDEMFPDTPV